jgi:hypothetical protein
VDAEQRLRGLYESFNSRDIDAVLAMTSEDIDWPNAWEGGRVRGHDAVRAYWLRQWAAIDPHVEPLSIRALPDGRVIVDVRQVVRNLDGELVADQRVRHIYELTGGLVTRMSVQDPESQV